MNTAIPERKQREFSMRNTERDRERLVVSRRPDDVTSPFRSRAPPGEEQEAQQFHKTERSQRAQTLDERRNAPLAEDVEEWKENPGRLDFPRVDTVQADDLELRAKTVAQKATSVDLLSGVERDGGIEPRGSSTQKRNVRGSNRLVREMTATEKDSLTTFSAVGLPTKLDMLLKMVPVFRG